MDNRGVSVGDGGVFVGRDVRGAEPCPVCETRLLTAGRTRCRQCQAKQEADAANARLVIFGVAALICLGMMLSFAEWLGIAAGAARLQFATMMTALLIGCATAVWIWFRQSRGPE